MRLDMPIFKSTNPGVEVMYTLWRFNVDAFLEQYDEASMCPHIFTSLRGYPGKWACTLDEGKDISVWDLLMHMERTFGNKRDYDAMIRTLYEVQQRDDEMVEEYMPRIHEAVVVICQAYPDRLPDRGWDLKKDCFYHGLCPYLHDALSFAMAELPERAGPAPHLTLYTRSLRSWKWDNWCICAGTPPALRCIGTSTGTTSCWWAGWQPWRKRGWHYLTRSQGRTPSLK